LVSVCFSGQTSVFGSVYDQTKDFGSNSGH
jgi:hypothetical protein